MFELVKNDDKLNVLFISDLHLCSYLDRMDLVYNAYEYAINKKIKYVINLGDLIDGVMPHNKKDIKIGSIEGQVKYVIDNYPKISAIKTLIIYGNHDYYSKYSNGLDVAKTLEKERTDLINLGYREAYVKIFDNYIKLEHEISCIKKRKINIGTNITFRGHYHTFKARIYDNNLFINVPSLSNMNPGAKTNVPSMLDVNFDFHDDVISKVEINAIDLEKNIISSTIESAVDTNPRKLIKIKEEVKKYGNNI